MLIVDSLIISGVRFVLTRLIEAVETEMYDETSLREELLAAQMKLELGEIDDEQFAAVEETVLAGLREVARRKKAAAAEAAGVSADEQAAGPTEGRKFTIESVEADLDHRDEPQ